MSRPFKVPRFALALIAGGALLGLLPHALGLVFGLGAAVLAIPAVALSAIVLGWWIARRLLRRRWLAVLVAAMAAGLAFTAGIVAQFALLARINGFWSQTLGLERALATTFQTAVAAALFIALGCALSGLKPRRP